MNRQLSVRIAALTIVLGTVVYVVADDSQHPREQIAPLQKQKIEVLEEIVSRYQFGHSQGQPILEELLDAEQDLLLMRLEVATAAEKRAEIHQLIVENREKLLEVRTAGLRLGKIPEVDLLRARVWLLDAKLAQENAKVIATP